MDGFCTFTATFGEGRMAEIRTGEKRGKREWKKAKVEQEMR